MRTLWPPINVIESRLQGITDEPLHFPDGKVESVPPSNPEMPGFLRDKIRQRVASRRAKVDATPKAGQIWRFDGGAEDAPVGVLLDEEKERGRWSGWLAAPETDYATHQDVLLEAQDEPFDPVAAMVQTWNPVVVDVSKASLVLAALTPARLDAIREVAQGQCADGGGARPGFVAPLMTASGAAVLAGTRIAHAEDPRHKYQALYREAAQKLERQFSAAASGKVVQIPQRRHLWRNIGWAMAASLVLAQSTIIASLLRERPAASVSSEGHDTSEYRSVPQPQDGYAYIEVNFKPDVREIDIRKLLTKLDATIADGPGEFGQYRLKVHAGSLQATLKALRSSGIAEEARE